MHVFYYLYSLDLYLSPSSGAQRGHGVNIPQEPLVDITNSHVE